LLDEGFDAATAASLSHKLLAAIREEAKGTEDFDVLLKRLQRRLGRGVLGDEFVRWLSPMMLAAVLGGVWQVQAEVPRLAPVPNVAEPATIEGGFFVQPHEAIEWFKAKKIVKPDEFAALDATAKARSFSVKHLTEDYTLETVKGSIEEALKTGENFTTWLTKLEDVLARAGLGTESVSVLHWELVYVQNTSLALSAGRYVQQMRVREERPFWLFWNPDPVTEVCITLEGKVFRADLFPMRYYPPNHFRCKSQILTMDADEVAAEGMRVWRGDEPDLDLLPVAKGFEFDPAQAFFLNKGVAGMAPTSQGLAAMQMFTS